MTILDEIRLTLPLPTLLSRAFLNNKKTGGKFKSKEYKDWIAEAEIAMMKHKKYKIVGDNWLQVDYVYYTKTYLDKPRKDGTDKKIIDTFNFEKCTSDFLSDHIEGFEDHKIIDGRVRKRHSDRREVEIIIKELR